MEVTTELYASNITTCADIWTPWCGDNEPWVDVIIDVFPWFLSAFTIIGNILVLLVFIKDRELRSNVTNLFILNLALADLLVGCISIPINNLYRSSCWWPFSATACRFWITMDFSECTVSVWAIVLISYDRNILVRKGLKYAGYQTLRKFLILSALVWIISFLRYFCSYVIYDWINGSPINYECGCYSDVLLKKGFVIYDMLTSNTIPVSLIAYFNIRLYVRIRELSRRRNSMAIIPTSTTRSSVSVSVTETTTNDEGVGHTFPAPASRPLLRRHRRAAVTLAVLVVVACLCWFPYFTITFLQVTFGINFSTRALIISYYIFYVNSAVNPILYVATNPRIRSGVVNILTMK